MHRVNVTFSDKDWAKLKRFCKKTRPYQPVGTTLREILLQHVTPCNTVLQPVPTPDPARAPVRDDQRSIEVPNAEDGPEQAITGLLESLKWYGAKLANGTTPAEFASNLLEAFPGADIGAELHKASAWLGQAPSRRKKYLGKFLLGWMGRIGKGPAYTPKKSAVETNATQQDFSPGGEWK